jgi:hypothetical protein
VKIKLDLHHSAGGAINSGTILLIIAGCLATLAAIVWIGLQVKPRPFEPYRQQQPPIKMVEIPKGLPAPVDIFYRKVYGDQLPVIHSAVISGRARLRFKGLTFPSRFRFVIPPGATTAITSTRFGRPA